jgi:hypothetical protein
MRDHPQKVTDADRELAKAEQISIQTAIAQRRAREQEARPAKG